MRLLAVELDGDEELLGLADDGLFLAEVVVLDVLLGDGGAGLLALAGDGVPAGAEHGLGVDGGLGVEVAVLGGQYGVLDGRGIWSSGTFSRLISPSRASWRAVRVEVDVGLRGGGGVGGGDVDQVVAGDEAADEEQRDEQHAAEHHAPGGEQPAPAGALAAAWRVLLRPSAPGAPSGAAGSGVGAAAVGSRGGQPAGPLGLALRGLRRACGRLAAPVPAAARRLIAASSLLRRRTVHVARRYCAAARADAVHASRRPCRKSVVCALW